MEKLVAFIDYIKAFDTIHKLKLWTILEKKKILYHLMHVIKIIHKSKILL
jgi:hypothetical protein